MLAEAWPIEAAVLQKYSNRILIFSHYYRRKLNQISSIVTEECQKQSNVVATLAFFFYESLYGKSFKTVRYVAYLIICQKAHLAGPNCSDRWTIST